jgi:hypothetical protein
MSTGDKVAYLIGGIFVVAFISVLVLAFWLMMNIWAKLPGQLAEKITLVGLIVAVFTLAVESWPIFQQWLLNRYVTRYCAAEDYEKEKIIEYAHYYIRSVPELRVLTQRAGMILRLQNTVSICSNSSIGSVQAVPSLY